MKIADTNALLSLIVDDRQEHTAFAEAAADGDAPPVLVTEVVLAETVWVLCSSYGRSRSDTARVVLSALSGPGVAAWDPRRARDALRLMEADPSLGIVDCLLLARGLDDDAEIVTFDQRLQKRAQEYVRI